MQGERAAGEQEGGGLRVRLPRDLMRCGSRSILPKPSAASEETATGQCGRRGPSGDVIAGSSSLLRGLR